MPTTLARLSLLALAGALLAAGCEEPAGGPSARAAEERAAAGRAGDAFEDDPPLAKALRTTAGALAMDTLNGQIQAADAALAADPREAETRRELVGLLSTRGQILGNVGDHARALALAEELVEDAPRDPAGHVARAAARGTLHLFDEALADLDEAEALGAPPETLLGQRAGILQAQGALDAALALRRADRERNPTVTALGSEAALLGELGEVAEALRLFHRAARAYRDTSPFPVAWLLVQEGLHRERQGEPTRARALYEEAHRRLPAHAQAASRLAQLEPPERAVALLAAVAQASDDPEPELLLTERLRRLGRAGEADRRLAHVRARYEELLGAHPEAFADHAAWFFLDAGEAPRALSLALQNLALRRTAPAYELALLAAMSAGARAEACALGRDAARLPHAPAMLRQIAGRACDAP